MRFICHSFEEFSKKVKALEELGIEYRTKKITSAPRMYLKSNITEPPRNEWIIETEVV